MATSQDFQESILADVQLCYSIVLAIQLREGSKVLDSCSSIDLSV